MFQFLRKRGFNNYDRVANKVCNIHLQSFRACQLVFQSEWLLRGLNKNILADYTRKLHSERSNPAGGLVLLFKGFRTN